MMATQLTQEGLSLNKALRLMGLSKSSYFYRRKKASEEEKLAQRLRELALENPAYGYRRLLPLLKHEGFKVGLKKIYALYRKLGLSLPSRKKRGYRRTPKLKDVFPIEPAERPSERWSIDFKEKRLANGTKVRILQVLDEATRYLLGGWWPRRVCGEDTAEYFDHLCRHYGPPVEIRRDDGPEFRSEAFQRVRRRWRIRERVIPPGSPYWNGFIESFHGKEEEEWLSREIFEDFDEFCRGFERFWWYYNYKRPHSSLGYRCPGEIWEEKYTHRKGGSENDSGK